jgi:predicted flap endonuclease-1-like 5' DNA nuclease
MNSPLIIGLLALFIGLAMGALVVFYLDTRSWGQKVQATAGERNKAQAMIQVLQARLQRAEKAQLVAEKEVQLLRQERNEREAHLRQREDEAQTLQEKLQTAETEIDQLQENLIQVNGHVDEMRRENQRRQQEWQAAVAQNQLLQENIERYNSELEALRAENQRINQQLAVAEVEMKHLQRDLAEADDKDARVNTLKVENDALVGQLNKAQIRLGELKAQLDGALHQLTETQFLRKKLVEMENRLKVAEAQAGTLQDKFTDMQSTFDHTGKNQLQIIRGIGPTFARRLNEAGILTLADLAQCTREQLAEIIQPKKGLVDLEEWIQEARELTVKFGNGAS